MHIGVRNGIITCEGVMTPCVYLDESDHSGDHIHTPLYILQRKHCTYQTNTRTQATVYSTHMDVLYSLHHRPHFVVGDASLVIFIIVREYLVVLLHFIL